MISNNDFSKKLNYLVKIILPLIIALLINVAVQIFTAIIIFTKNALSSQTYENTVSAGDILSRDFAQPMTKAYMLAARYGLYILIFGFWYYKNFVRPNKDIDIFEDESSFGDKFKGVFVRIKSIFANVFTKKANLEENETDSEDTKSNSDENIIVKSPNKFKKVLITVAGIILFGYACQLITDSVLNFIELRSPESIKEYSETIGKTVTVNSSFLLYLTLFIISPMGEEFLFRGVIQSFAKKVFAENPKISRLFAILVTAMTFGIYHGNLIQGIYAFIFGLILSYLKEITGTICYPILLHISINSSIKLIPNIFVSSELACAISFTICLIIIFAGITACRMYYDNKNE